MFRSFFILFLLYKASLAFSQSTELPVGEVIDTVRCSDVPSQSYAAYLPAQYNEDKLWPIIYFFEPRARGRLPVSLYSSVADSLGYILVCSNNSRNGPIKNSINAFEVILEHTREKFRIDSSRMYTSGFSGGGRFAQLLASTYEEVSGVIAVAGPVSHALSPDQTKYNYFGIVGNRDMNYVEHKSFQENLNQLQIKNVLLTYDGPHQWAPAKHFASALAWLNIQHLMQSSGVGVEQETDKHLIAEIQRTETSTDQKIAAKYYYLKTLKYSLEPHRNPQLTKHIKAYETNKDLLKALAKEKKILSKETKDYEEILMALFQLKISSFNKDIPLDSTSYAMGWWQQKIKDLQARTKKNDNRGNVAARTLDVIRGQVFGIHLQASAETNLDFKLNLSKIQAMLHPKSVWVIWNQAIIFAKKDERQSALECVKLAGKIDEEQLGAIRKTQSDLAIQFPYLFQ